jgi:hypothetical protein
MEHVLGKYMISDKPMTEEEWARERADVIDAEPARDDLVRQDQGKPAESQINQHNDSRNLLPGVCIDTGVCIDNRTRLGLGCYLELGGCAFELGVPSSQRAGYGLELRRWLARLEQLE